MKTTNAEITTLAPRKCPTCESPDPKLHPATQYEGEVCRICADPFHAASPAPRYTEGYCIAERYEAAAAPDATLVEKVRALQVHAREQGWQDCDEPIADLLAHPLPEVPK